MTLPEKPKAKAPRKSAARKSPPKEAFGAKLKAARIREGLSQEEMAKRAGMATTRIPPIELGKMDVRLSTARKLAAALGVALRDLL